MIATRQILGQLAYKNEELKMSKVLEGQSPQSFQESSWNIVSASSSFPFYLPDRRFKFVRGEFEAIFLFCRRTVNSFLELSGKVVIFAAHR